MSFLRASFQTGILPVFLCLRMDVSPDAGHGLLIRPVQHF